MSLDKARLEKALDEYKGNFPKRWKKEKYKWKATQIFEDKWDLSVTDEKLPEMITESLSGLKKLPQFWRSRDVIVDLAKNHPKDVRSMFEKLFAETPAFEDRVEKFKDSAQDLYSRDEEIKRKYKEHQQGESAVSIYLWLKYPQKYYIYKHEAAEVLANKLKYNYEFPKGRKLDIQKDNLRNFLNIYNEISACIKADITFMSHFKECITNTKGGPYFLDSECKTLTSDFGFYMKDNFTPPVAEPNGPVDDSEDEYEYEDEPTIPSVKYWWLNSNPKIWRISSLPVGKTQSYTLYNESNHKRRIFQNFIDAKIGDRVIGYESTPTRQIVSICEVSAKQEDKEIEFRKLESLDSPIDLADIKNVPELAGMEFFVNPNGSFFKLTKEEYSCLIDIIREENPKKTRKNYKSYDKNIFLQEVFMDDGRFNQLLALLKSKKNIILKGVPGVGKTWAATRLAYVMMGKMDDSKIESIQFHQNYSYEDFMMGYKPAEDASGESKGASFTLKNGTFYRFCLKARNHPKDDYFFIIDEINRGNMSKIFGELLMLIEKEYRGDKKKVTLPYKDEMFSVPENIYIIGMMNTADRSLAMIDYALRRRFGHFELEPAFDTDSFKAYKKSLNNATFDKLIDAVIDLNKDIVRDNTLGKGFCIGHSYFCNWNPENKETMADKMRSVVDFEILPMLEEYWFDNTAKVNEWKKKLYNALGVSDATAGAE